MCCYLFSKETDIRVKYCSETIKFLKDGSTQVTADILIENVGTSPLGKIFVLYPNSFQYPAKLGFYEDITPSFMDFPKHSSENYHYKSMGYNFRSEERELKFRELDSIKRNYLTLEHPYLRLPIISDKYRRFYTNISGWCLDSEILLLEWERILANYYVKKGIKANRISEGRIRNEALLIQSILTTIRYSVFCIQWQYPLDLKEKVWFRLKFTPNNLPYHNEKNLFHKIKLSALNELFYNYQIIGPTDVLYRFVERLVTAKLLNQSKISTGERAKEEQSYRKISDFCSILLSEILGISDEGPINLSGLDYTKYDIWQLHLYPSQLRVLFQFFSSKNIELIGDYPDVIPQLTAQEYLPPFKLHPVRYILQWIKYTIETFIDRSFGRMYKYRVYKWTSYGAKVDDVEDDGFVLSFSGKRHYRILEVLPFIILFLSVVMGLLWLLKIPVKEIASKIIASKIFIAICQIRDYIGAWIKKHPYISLTALILIIGGNFKAALQYIGDNLFAIWKKGKELYDKIRQ